MFCDSRGWGWVIIVFLRFGLVFVRGRVFIKYLLND